MNTNRTKKLFKKAYLHNWDNGIDSLVEIINDKDCDKATATMIFWYGSPDYYYNKAIVSSLDIYEMSNYTLLKKIEKKILNHEFQTIISFEIDELYRVEPLGKIPIELTHDIQGKFDYKEILNPNHLFQEKIIELCQNCSSINDFYSLEKKGVDFNLGIYGPGNITPIELSIQSGQVEALKYFIQKKYNLKKNYNKNPLLFKAILSKNIEVVKLLIDNGIDVNKKGEFRRTSMHFIAGLVQGNISFDEKIKKITIYLLSKGADLNLKDINNRKPIDIAKKWRNKKFIQFLSNYKRV